MNLLKSIPYILLLLFMAHALFAGQELTEEQTRRIKALEGSLIAPCCWTQTVNQHESKAAHDIRKQVEELVVKGRTDDEILAGFVEQYGERILAAPAKTGFNLLAYLLPLAVILLAVIFITYRAVISKRSAPADTTLHTPEKNEWESRLDRELDNY